MDQEEEDQTLDQRLTQLTQTQELQLQESRLLLESVNNFKEYFVELGKMVKNLRQAVADNAGSLESIGNRPAPAPAQAAKQDDNLTRELLYGPQRFKVTVRVQNAILSQSKNIPLVWLAQSPKKDSDHDPKEFANSQFKITARSKARFYNFEQINDAIRLFWYVIRESDLSNDAKDGAMQITQAFQEIIAQYNRRPEIILWGWEQLMTKCTSSRNAQLKLRDTNWVPILPFCKKFTANSPSPRSHTPTLTTWTHWMTDLQARDPIATVNETVTTPPKQSASHSTTKNLDTKRKSAIAGTSASNVKGTIQRPDVRNQKRRNKRCHDGLGIV